MGHVINIPKEKHLKMARGSSTSLIWIYMNVTWDAVRLSHGWPPAMVSIMEHRTILIIIGESSKIIYTNQTFYMAVFADIRGL